MGTPLLGLTDTVLLSRFREFYAEVIRLKRLIAQPSPAGQAGEQSTETTKTDPIVLEVWQRLLSVLERQALMAGDQPSFSLEVYREAQYVMAALADDVFVHLDWQGKDFWMSHLLESKLFNTHVAGEEIFKKVDRLLKDRDPVYADLAAVYFMALALGFRGRYYGQSDLSPLDLYRRETFSFIFRDDPRVREESRYLFPKAYTRTLEELPKERFKDMRLWLSILAVVTATWLLSSHLQWVELSDKLKSDVTEVLALIN